MRRRQHVTYLSSLWVVFCLPLIAPMDAVALGGHSGGRARVSAFTVNAVQKGKRAMRDVGARVWGRLSAARGADPSIMSQTGVVAQESTGHRGSREMMGNVLALFLAGFALPAAAVDYKLMWNQGGIFRPTPNGEQYNVRGLGKFDPSKRHFGPADPNAHTVEAFEIVEGSECGADLPPPQPFAPVRGYEITVVVPDLMAPPAPRSTASGEESSGPCHLLESRAVGQRPERRDWEWTLEHRPSGERWFGITTVYTVGEKGLEVGSQPYHGYPAGYTIPPETVVSSDMSDWVGTK